MLTVLPVLIPAPQKCVNPKEKAMFWEFSFGIRNFWCAGINRGTGKFMLRQGN